MRKIDILNESISDGISEEEELEIKKLEEQFYKTLSVLDRGRMIRGGQALIDENIKRVREFVTREI